LEENKNKVSIQLTMIYM